MNDVDYWNLFELTGSIHDYLNYACTSEEGQTLEQEEGGQADESGNGSGNGFIGHARWRI